MAKANESSSRQKTEQDDGVSYGSGTVQDWFGDSDSTCESNIWP